MTNYWLMKSEPTCFGINDLYNKPNHTWYWDAIRNYQARNYIRNDMQIGDQAFFYHSNCNPPGIVGTMEIVSEAYPDFTAFDPTSDHADSRSTPENPIWFMVDVRFKEKFSQIIALEKLRHYPELEKMPLLRRGNRLSITPVSKEEWTFIKTVGYT